MPLKLLVGKRDRIIMSNGIMIEVKSIGQRIQLEFTAPRNVKIHTIFNDPTKQFKNLMNEAKRQLQESADAMLEDIDDAPMVEPGQDLTPEQQQAIALDDLKRRNKQ